MALRGEPLLRLPFVLFPDGIHLSRRLGIKAVGGSRWSGVDRLNVVVFSHVVLSG